MRKLQIGLVCFIVFAFIWKFLDYPFGNIALILSLLFLSCLYFYLGFALFNKIGFKDIFKKKSYADISSLRIIGTVLSGFSLSILLLGMLFKIMNWPFASQNLLIGILGLVIALFVAGIVYLRKRSPFYIDLFKTIIPYLSVGILLYFSGYFFLEREYKDYPEYIEIVKKLNEDPNNQELQKKEREFNKRIRSDHMDQNKK